MKINNKIYSLQNTKEENQISQNTNIYLGGIDNIFYYYPKEDIEVEINETKIHNDINISDHYPVSTTFHLK